MGGGGKSDAEGRCAVLEAGAMEPDQLGGGLVGLVQDVGDDVIYVLAGEIDLANVEALQERLSEVADRVAGGHLYVDMGGVTFIDSAGVRHLLASHMVLAEGGIDLTLVNVAPAPERAIRLAGVWDLLSFGHSPSA